MSAPANDGDLPGGSTERLRNLQIADVDANPGNPRLDFPQDELDRLSGSIDLEGVLVPIVVYPKDKRYVLIDGERRFRCSRDLGLETIPAVITAERSERDVLQQMFNIHLIREQWRDIPTAKALQRLATEISAAEGSDPTEKKSYGTSLASRLIGYDNCDTS